MAWHLEVCLEVIECRGHPNIQAAHESTAELTCEDRVTPRGDCVLCISCSRLSDCCGGGWELVAVSISTHPLPVAGGGSPGYWRVTCSGGGEACGCRLVLRRSGFVDSDTLGRWCGGSAANASRVLSGLSSPFTRCFVLVVRVRGVRVVEEDRRVRED